jgi:hypothetical protein
VLVELEDEDLGVDYVMDEPDEDADDGVDLSTAEGVDLSMAESDAASVEDVATEANDVSLPALTCAKLNLGRFAVTKVSIMAIKPNPIITIIIPAMKPSQTNRQQPHHPCRSQDCL